MTHSLKRAALLCLVPGVLAASFVVAAQKPKPPRRTIPRGAPTWARSGPGATPYRFDPSTYKPVLPPPAPPVAPTWPAQRAAEQAALRRARAAQPVRTVVLPHPAAQGDMLLAQRRVAVQMMSLAVPPERERHFKWIGGAFTVASWSARIVATDGQTATLHVRPGSTSDGQPVLMKDYFIETYRIGPDGRWSFVSGQEPADAHPGFYTIE
jgi:hypothetical protein